VFFLYELLRVSHCFFNPVMEDFAPVKGPFSLRDFSNSTVLSPVGGPSEWSQFFFFSVFSAKPFNVNRFSHPSLFLFPPLFFFSCVFPPIWFFNRWVHPEEYRPPFLLSLPNPPAKIPFGPFDFWDSFAYFRDPLQSFPSSFLLWNCSTNIFHSTPTRFG